MSEQRFTVNEKGGHLPYMIAWVSQGGWISTEQIATYAELKQRENGLRALGLAPAIFIVLTNDVEVSEK